MPGGHYGGRGSSSRPLGAILWHRPDDWQVLAIIGNAASASRPPRTQMWRGTARVGARCHLMGRGSISRQVAAILSDEASSSRQVGAILWLAPAPRASPAPKCGAGRLLATSRRRFMGRASCSGQVAAIWMGSDSSTPRVGVGQPYRPCDPGLIGAVCSHYQAARQRAVPHFGARGSRDGSSRHIMAPGGRETARRATLWRRGGTRRLLAPHCSARGSRDGSSRHIMAAGRHETAPRATLQRPGVAGRLLLAHCDDNLAARDHPRYTADRLVPFRLCPDSRRRLSLVSGNQLA